MSIRREPTYLSTEVWRALRLIAKSKSVEEHIITPDEIADSLLRVAIGHDYPQIYEHLKAVEKMEKEVIKSLK